MVEQPTITNPQIPDDEKFFAALGYIAFLFVLTLLAKPRSTYCQFHAKQSMVLFLLTIVVLVFLAAVPWFGSLLTLGLFAIYVLAIYRAYRGELWNIPFVSSLAQKLDIASLYGKSSFAISAVSQLKEKATDFASKASETVKTIGKDEEKAEPPSPPAPDSSAQPQNPKA